MFDWPLRIIGNVLFVVERIHDGRQPFMNGATAVDAIRLYFLMAVIVFG